MSTAHHFFREDGSCVEVCVTDSADGDFHIDSDPTQLRARRSDVMRGEWAAVRQVHGACVVEADPSRTPDADALITDASMQPIAVQAADCAPIGFITDVGPIAVAHAGWRGLAAGVVQHTVEGLLERGASTRCAVVGPLIGPECYEFGADDLSEVAAALGDDVRATTSSGSPALDLRAAITLCFASVDVADVRFIGGCTACEGAGFSHRARSEGERHALVARILPTGVPT